MIARFIFRMAYIAWALFALLLLGSWIEGMRSLQETIFLVAACCVMCRAAFVAAEGRR